ncbi:hypothetical protein [Methyloglobulus sp.]|uniref:hypothetical protein n=1 Tax=Methyloglobulus sp. TaxID=2518622 RepID=UPI0018179F4C|nr:hypothetical protein [Methyloglobulus sp.]
MTSVFKRIKVNFFTAFVARNVGRLLASSAKEYVFVVSTGRCGTNTLANICAKIPKCESLHEPHPMMNGDIMISYNQGDEKPAKNQFYLRKLPHIFWASAFSTWYIESSHMFIKSFGDFAYKTFGSKLRLIHLTRDPIEVSNSYYLRGNIPGTPIGDDWTLNYRAAKNSLNLSELLDTDERFQHDFFKCLWYWYEIEARMIAFSAKYPSVPVVHIDTNAFNDIHALEQLFRQLNIPVGREVLSTMVGTRSNRSNVAPALPENINPEDITAFQDICNGHLRKLKEEYANNSNA